MRFRMLDQVLLPFEKTLRAQERFRRLIGVKEVDRPTYEKYITGTVERFDRRKNIFMALLPDNPYGKEFREKFRHQTGVENQNVPLPYSELEMGDRMGQSLAISARRLCNEYHPVPLPINAPEGRMEVQDRGWLTRLIKKVGLFWGAQMVRVTEIDPRWVYQDISIPHKFAIIFVVSHFPGFNHTAPSFLSGAAVADTYSRLKFITTQMTDFIRGLGYDAMYRETLGWNPEMLMVPLAIDAGVGEFARTGRCLSPEFGVNMRLKAVTTDLPLQVDRPISFGVHEFCMACENCAAYCPAHAIPDGPPTDTPDFFFHNPGYKKWHIRADRCILFFAENRKKWLTCGGRCISVCPWNKPWNVFHNLVRWTAVHSPREVKKWLVWSDRVIYNRKKSITK